MLPLFSKISSRCTLLPRPSLASGLWRRQEPLDRTAGEQYRITKLFPSQKSGGAFGRFINEDKAHFESGYNFYRYLRNSPTRFIDPFGLADVNPQDMASLQGLFPSFTPLCNTEIVVPMPCDQAREILEQNNYYSSDNRPSISTPVPLSGGLAIPGNPFLFWDPIAHSGGESGRVNCRHFAFSFPGVVVNTVSQ